MKLVRNGGLMNSSQRRLCQQPQLQSFALLDIVAAKRVT